MSLGGSSGPGREPTTEAVVEAVRQARARGLDPDDLLWVAIPTALLDLPNAEASGTRWRATANTLLAGLSARRGSHATVVDDVLFAYEGANPGATLRPVVAAYATAHDQSASTCHARPRLRQLVRGLRAAKGALAALDAPLGSAPPAIERAVHAAVRAMARAERLLDVAAPHLVVVASQHSTASRALILAARRRSVATAYLPHAPAADTYQYRDLPTDFAAVRGEAENDFYRDLGARRDLRVVGNPQAHVRPPAVIDPDGPVIFAPRPQPLAIVREQVEQVAAVAPEVVVSPHPRMRDRGYEALWPDHWQRHDGPTIELLAAGHPCTIQRSSGVAWESLAHGIPAVELGHGPGVYLVIREPYVPSCDTVAALGAALRDARRAAADPVARRSLMDWAGQWCAATGDDAVERAVTWIDDCRRGAQALPGPLLDAWAAPGAAA